ncbi:LPS export ABC transporter periplasmic protein LptC [Flavobacterium cheonhonense]|jgi:LPS export ABC transporter protein LptC|uniref:LPS export ABC transporter periplasmic protein LptC n=1 Tax=Flavobacterium cheonhonense TaxID=706185 RepID=A0ABP7TVA5_9FLAO|nr:LPS export ABC transporter periplasmic protein LptC [Flavobacterium cheonhonense]PJE41138.1 MAG: LPS export ABC transporter periplasmic protein LptC [Flavobacterium sp.] [Flavobacterium sp. FEMGT703F]
MSRLFRNTIPLFAVLFGLAVASCESNFKEVQKMGLSEFTPSGDADSINLKYTDSGRITANLISPKMLDYATVAYPFTEFPNGMHLTLFDKNGKQTYIDAKYAISHKTTNIIDLQGNVKISNQNGELLETEQLYYDQKNEWFFTEKKFKFTSPKGVSYGEGIDFSKDFKKVNSQKISGQVQSE